MNEADTQTARNLNAEIERMKGSSAYRETLHTQRVRIMHLELENDLFKSALSHIALCLSLKNECCNRADKNGHLIDHVLSCAGHALR